MKVLRLLVGASPRMAWLSTLAGVASGIAHTGLLALVNQVIAAGGKAGAWLALAFALLVVVKLASQGWSQVLLNRFSQRAISSLRQGLARKILAAPLRRLEEIGTPRLMASLTDDVMLIADAYRALPRMAVNTAILLSCSVYLAWLSWTVLLGVTVFGLLGVLTYKLLLRDAMKSLRAARDVQDSLFAHFHALTQGTKELKLNAKRRAEFLEQGIDRSTRDFERHNREASLRLAVTFGWSQLIYFALIGLLLFLLPRLQEIDARTLTGYVVTTLYLMGPITIVIDTIPTIGAANVALAKIEGLGLGLEEVREPQGAPAAAPLRFDRVELDAAVFGYHGQSGDHDFVLGPIDLTLQPGEVLFVVGGNGSGKSTLSKLLTGLYAPEQGRVLLNGQVVDEAGREEYRQLFSTVFSDFWLFERFLGADPASIDARANEWLRRLELDRKVKVEGGALSTTALSSGQRKRLALLAARLEDRPIYVFDEWAADQDPEFKEVFYRRLLPELKSAGKGVVVISHDDRWFDAADRLVRLESGRISAEQTAADLALRGGGGERA